MIEDSARVAMRSLYFAQQQQDTSPDKRDRITDRLAEIEAELHAR